MDCNANTVHRKMLIDVSCSSLTSIQYLDNHSDAETSGDQQTFDKGAHRSDSNTLSNLGENTVVASNRRQITEISKQKNDENICSSTVLAFEEAPISQTAHFHAELPAIKHNYKVRL